jgi:hypothetical protein
MTDPEPDASLPQDVPPNVPPNVPTDSERKRRGWGFWIAMIAGALGVLCCGGGLLVRHFARDWIAIMTAPEKDRPSLLDRKLREFAAEQMSAADAFLAAVDAGNDDAAWDATSAVFRATTTRERFGESAQLVRDVMGPVQSKILRSIQTNKRNDEPAVTHLAFGATFAKGEGTISLDLEYVDKKYEVRSWRTDSPLFTEAMKRGAKK